MRWSHRSNRVGSVFVGFVVFYAERPGGISNATFYQEIKYAVGESLILCSAFCIQ